MTVRIIKNNTYQQLCFSCLMHFDNPKILYNILLSATYQDQNNLLCPKCLFNLLLELNNMFELNPMLDGTTESATELRNRMEIPPQVYRYIMSGEKIRAIKELRTIAGHHVMDLNDKNTYFEDYKGRRLPIHKLSLMKAKQKVDVWWNRLRNESPNWPHLNNIDPN